MDETLEEWAARVAPTLSTAEWAVINGRGRYEDARALNCAHGYVAAKRALLAYRDKAAAKSTKAQRAVLEWLSDGQIHSTREPRSERPSEQAIKSASRSRLCKTQHVAVGGGAYDLRVVRSDFGREIARVLSL